MTVPSEELRPLNWPTIPERVKWFAAGIVWTLAILAIGLGMHWLAHRRDVAAFGVLVPKNAKASWIDVQGTVPFDNCRNNSLRGRVLDERLSVVVELWYVSGPGSSVCTLIARTESTQRVRISLERPLGDRVVYDGNLDSQNHVPRIGTAGAQPYGSAAICTATRSC